MKINQVCWWAAFILVIAYLALVLYQEAGPRGQQCSALGGYYAIIDGSCTKIVAQPVAGWQPNSPTNDSALGIK